MNLTEAAEYHRRTLERLGRRPDTLRLYKLYEDSYLAFLLEHDVEPDLEALNTQFAREWQAWLRARSHGSRGGAVTEKMAVITLRTWARFLWDNDIFSYNPLARLKVPRVTRLHQKPFSQDEVRHLVVAAAGGSNPIRDRALLLLMLDTGCRVGELCGLELGDVDLTQGSVLFRQTKNGHPRQVIFRVASRRDGGPALSALRQWLRVREARDGVEALFTTRERFPLSTRRVREIFAELGEAGRVPNAHPHRMRHSAATEFLAAQPGAENQLRSRLGHLSHQVLADYVSISDPTAAAAAEVASLSTRWKL